MTKRSLLEKIVYLPHCYQVNDAKRAISEKVFSREEMGLPRDGFVFCCFSNSFKSLPEVFDCWMRIVKKVQEAFRGSWKLMKPRLAI
jgi:protein O-GlcNAc transferase